MVIMGNNNNNNPTGSRVENQRNPSIVSNNNLHIFVGRSNTFLQGTKTVGVAHLAEFHGQSAAEAAENAGRLLSRCLEHGLRLLESAAAGRKR